ncbi:hypothetical protein AB0873_20765 [Micromonospora sp. NPDC047707]|uniref:hypothetical protein n=1 Tax=Micromonospora sp. NPDC047707 TaxID=3154498 RepID=UPI003455A10D
MSTELRVTLPGPEGSADARRALAVLDRFLTLLGRLEDATLKRPVSRDHTTWSFTDVRLGSLVTTLAPNRLASGATSVTIKEIAGTTVMGLATAQHQEGLPPGWTLQAARAGAELAQLLGLLVSDGMILELLENGKPQGPRVMVTRQAAENLAAAVKTRRHSIGSVIGRLDAISLHDRREAGLWHERTGERIAVTFDPSQMDEIRAALGKRVEIAGRLTRDAEDRPLSVKMRSLEVLQDAPVTDLIGLDPNLTGGRDPVDYLREIRGAS